MCILGTESTSEIVSGDYGGQTSKMIYAVFTTPRNSISANAICAFRLRDLLDTFEGAFKEQDFQIPGNSSGTARLPEDLQQQTDVNLAAAYPCSIWNRSGR